MLKQKLIKGFHKKNGRNNQGKITVKNKERGHKKCYRLIDFKYNFKKAIVQNIEYDPNRNTNILKIFIHEFQQYRFILAVNNLKINDIILKDNITHIKQGNILKIKYIPIGSIISNIELYPSKGAQISRSAGTSCQLIQKINDKYALLKLPSNKTRKILLNCIAVLGQISIKSEISKNKNKAGYSRWLGIRPHVRGVAMNPVDHPHGGGEGKTSGGRPSVNKKGIYTKGVKTRRKKNKTNIYVKI